MAGPEPAEGNPSASAKIRNQKKRTKRGRAEGGHRITIALVRISQKGNVLATRELIGLLRYMVDEWIDRYFFMRRWRGAESEIDPAIEGCIRRYRYTGTFFGYLFKTFEYSVNRLKPFPSLDSCLPGTDMRLSEIVGQDSETGEVKIYR